MGVRVTLCTGDEMKELEFDEAETAGHLGMEEEESVEEVRGRKKRN